MGNLIKEWVSGILTEQINKKVVVYAGRFQPFHKGHYATYQNLVKQFGKDSVYIGTSDKTDNIKSPFNFKEKKVIMMKMFGIPSNKIVQIKNPYAPTEIINKFPEESTAFITVVGEKDRYRLKGKYFEPYHPDKVQIGYKDKGYVYVSPAQPNAISGTDVRNWLSKGSDSNRMDGFKKAYGKFDKNIFDLVSGKLYKVESTMERFINSFDMNQLMVEAGIYNADMGEPETGYLPGGTSRVLGDNRGKPEPWYSAGGYTQMEFPKADYIYSKDSTRSDKASFSVVKRVEPNRDLNTPIETDDFVTKGIGSKGEELHKIEESNSTATAIGGNTQGVDDGPGAYYGNSKSYKAVGEETARRLGWQVVDYILGTDEDSIYADDARGIEDKYPVSYFPSGLAGLDAQSHRYTDLKGNVAYKTWVKHITKVATMVGYTLVDFLDAKKAVDSSKNEPKKVSDPNNTTDVETEKFKELKESLITEGGAYGHMNHPFDIEMNLTFGDLKAIIKGALNGNLELAREKTDGQALAISWRDDRGLIAARNKSHLKNKGAEALTIKGVADKFANRGGLTDAYNFAMKDLESAIKGLSKAQRDKIFQQGASFMNLEVIYPTSVNVIPYDQPLLVFHNTTEYNEAGEGIGANQSAARILAGMIKQINKDVQNNYTIQGPPVTELPKSQKLSTQQSKFESMLKKLQGEFKLKDSDGVADYHQAWWEQWVDKNSPETLTNDEKMGLVKRWAFNDKGFRLDNKNIKSSKVLDWAKSIDTQDKEKISKENTMKFEDIFLGVGAEVLSFMSSVLAANPDKAVRDMKNELDTTIKAVQKSGDIKKIEKLRLELERLARLGGKDKIVPNEGIVFVYKGNTYKLTGAFAPLNQILGLMYF
jgi:hypothetical protein